MRRLHRSPCQPVSQGYHRSATSWQQAFFGAPGAWDPTVSSTRLSPILQPIDSQGREERACAPRRRAGVLRPLRRFSPASRASVVGVRTHLCRSMEARGARVPSRSSCAHGPRCKGTVTGAVANFHIRDPKVSDGVYSSCTLANSVALISTVRWHWPVTSACPMPVCASLCCSLCRPTARARPNAGRPRRRPWPRGLLTTSGRCGRCCSIGYCHGRRLWRGEHA